ncbi:MAG: hypothetical protein P4M00_14555 [Azospirillaceae bacterium]|nr:hypothetical protein [Azospirillaceae bacterium]
MDRTYRTYDAILIGLIAVAALCGAIVVEHLQPLSGDLTRLGGYAENDFGWTGTEQVFAPPLAAAGQIGRADDIVVLGDSFSLRSTPDRQTPAGGFWTDFLAAGTGLSVGVFFIEKMPVEQFIAANRDRPHPPRLVILELVERSLRHQVLDGTGAGACTDAAPAHRARFPGLSLPPAFTPRSAVPLEIVRDTAPRWSETGVGQAVDHLAKSIPRWLVGWDDATVRRLPLSRPDLFTSRLPGELLVYRDDLAKAAWTDGDWAAIRCRLLDWQVRTEANGRTTFLVVVPPDKSSAYAPYLPADARQPDGIARLAEASALHLPRVDLALRQAIQSGVRDVYLPNDTHWGTAGSRIAATSVIDYLKEHAGPRPEPMAGRDHPTAMSRESADISR